MSPTPHCSKQDKEFAVSPAESCLTFGFDAEQSAIRDPIMAWVCVGVWFLVKDSCLQDFCLLTSLCMDIGRK